MRAKSCCDSCAPFAPDVEKRWCEKEPRNVGIMLMESPELPSFWSKEFGCSGFLHKYNKIMLSDDGGCMLINNFTSPIYMLIHKDWNDLLFSAGEKKVLRTMTLTSNASYQAYGRKIYNFKKLKNNAFMRMWTKKKTDVGGQILTLEMLFYF